MLDNETKRKIDSARSILVGKVPDPKAQVEQITTALIYKFMDDMDREAEELGGNAKFLVGELESYKWANLMDKSLGGSERLNLYMSALLAFAKASNIPEIFRTIFKDAFLPYRDPETLNLFLKEVDYFDYDHSENLGNAFEYLLSILGSQGDAGQFRTPRHIIDFIVEVLEPKKDETLPDPACGTAGFLISAYKHITKNNPKITPDEKKALVNHFTGYDISPDMVRLSLVNMYLHSFPTPKIYEYDTLTSEDRWNESFDVILANPPFMTPKGGIRPHNRFSVQANRSEVLFVDYIAEHLSLNGRAGIIVPEGIIFQSANAYKALRKMLVENGFLWAVVSLPAGVFQPYSGVKTSILLLDRTIAKRSEDILFVKISNDGYDLGAQRREIAKNDLPEALEVLKNYRLGVIGSDSEAIQKIAQIVPKSKIAESGDHNLTGDRYRENTRTVQTAYSMVKLGDVCEIFADGDWIESKDQSESGIRLIQTGNVGIGEFLDKGSKARFISEDTFKRLNCTEIFENDILVSRLPEPVGRACLVPFIKTRAITSVDRTIIRTTFEILPNFLLNIMCSEQYFEYISSYLTGASRQRISRKNLEEIEIPLPPLEIQNQIVAQIEEWQKIIDGAKQVINSYHPAITIDPSWEMVKLGDVCEFVRGPFGGSLKKDIFVDNGYAIYEQSHAIYNNFDNFRYFVDKTKFEEMKRFEVRTNDLIMSCSGTMGKTAIVPDTAPIGIINQALLKLTTKKELSVQFLKLWMDSDNFQSLINQNVGGAAIQNVASVKILSELEIPLPPLEIQNQIVEQIEKERQAVESCKSLIEMFEAKIKTKIDEVWGKAE